MVSVSTGEQRAPERAMTKVALTAGAGPTTEW